jgi:radical SAM superfamily enzyme YgiQ (UPF0313 family)
MVSAELKMVLFGIESASQDILSNYNRSINDFEKIKTNINYLVEKRVVTSSFYMIGFPEDNCESINKTFNIAQELNTDYVAFNIYTPYPGLRSWKNDACFPVVSPEIFIPFENTLKVKSCNNLSNEELNFLFEHITFNYYERKYGMQEALNFNRSQINLKNKIKKITEYIKHKHIFELTKID